ncbi:MAG: non-hydrolyzing UDP-N-acetylglucosamine 2-epimerase [Nitrososphaerales archaeon]
MRLAIVLGTRPEIIKMSPIIKECESRGLEYFIVHSGQHYSYNLDRIFFEQLELPHPHYKLEVGSGTHATQTGKIMAGVEKVISQKKPNIVLVEGDTNTVLAAALAAAKLHILVGHVEAGLRSYDRRMPEEINRVLTDHCSDYLFAPTKKAEKILRTEGVPSQKIFVTGNTVVDALYQNIEIAKRKTDIMDRVGLSANEYFLATVHREENVDNFDRLYRIIKALELLQEKFGISVIYPIHPRSKKMLKRFKIICNRIKLVDPLDYLSFLELERNAKLILTDSGGVQEEACILKVPCVTLRDNTERPETIEVRANMIAGTKPEKILRCVDIMLNRHRGWRNPFGKGDAGKRIMKILGRI